MYQTADNQLNEIIDLLTVIQSSWNGLLIYKIRSQFRLRFWSWSWGLRSCSWSCRNGSCLHHRVAVKCLWV